MLRYIVSFLIALAIIPLAEAVPGESKATPPAIVWEKSFEDAITKAKAAGKSVLLDFFAPT